MPIMAKIGWIASMKWEKNPMSTSNTHLQTKTDQSKSTEASKTEEDVYEEIRFTICTLPHQMFVPFLL